MRLKPNTGIRLSLIFGCWLTGFLVGALVGLVMGWLTSVGAGVVAGGVTWVALAGFGTARALGVTAWFEGEILNIRNSWRSYRVDLRSPLEVFIKRPTLVAQMPKTIALRVNISDSRLLARIRTISIDAASSFDADELEATVSEIRGAIDRARAE